jgi:uncharacterized membrane protein
VPELIAIGYRDMATAFVAVDDVERHSAELHIQLDAVAGIIRDEAGRFTAIANAVVPSGPTYVMFWGLLFTHLFFVPFLGMALGTNLRRLVIELERLGVSPEFETGVRGALTPGASVLFAMVESPDRLIRTLRRHGGTVMRTGVPLDAFAEVHEALHGRPTPERRSATKR